MKEIVMGLHWAPAQSQFAVATVDLDALCVLLEEDQKVIEVISPSHPRTAADSVVHTGNSPDGANQWDDERVFVFLEALPSTVTQVTFCVLSVSGQPFSQVAGARCHLGDARREQPLLRVDLTTHRDATFLAVFSLRRQNGDWQLVNSPPDTSPALRTAVMKWHAEHGDAEETPAA